MGDIIFWVEGKDDESFFNFFLKSINQNSYKIHSLNGKDNIKKNKDFKEEKEKGNKVTIIIDADDSKNEYKKILDGYKQSKEIDNYFFIEPDLETFLLQLVDEKFLDCINKYEECTKKELNKVAFKLSSKSKLYAFFESSTQYKSTDSNRWKAFDYNNNNNFLVELKSFFSKIFQQTNS